MGGPPKPPPKGRRGLPGWIPIALISFLILGGITLIGIGFLTDAGEQETAAPAQEAPQQGDQPQGEGQQQPAEPAPEEQAPAPAAPAVDRRTFANQFEIGVPAGWQTGERDGGTLLSAPGGAAEVVVLFGSQQPAGQLGSVAAQILGNQYSGAQAGKPKPANIGGLRAVRVTGEFRGGEVAAYALNGGGETYVLTQRIARGASAEVSGQAAAVIESFRPL